MKFVIMGNPRAGTTSLLHLFLDNGLKGINEPFNKKARVWIPEFDKLKISRRGKSIDLFQSFLQFDARYDLIKHLIYSLCPARNRLMAETYRTIFLYRVNVFEAALSSAIAQRLNIWSFHKMNDNYNQELIQINEKFLDRQCQKYRAKNHEILGLYNSRQKTSILLSYESLYYYKTNESLDKIRNFTGLELNNLDKIGPEYKMNKEVSYDRIINLKLIEKKYKEYGELKHK